MTRVIGRACALATLVVLALLVRGAFADPFFDSSPGALTQSHASLDAKDHCNDCHVGDSKELSEKKCLDCHDHEKLGERIKAGLGFHASAGVKGKKCESCHHEHKGKKYDLMGWSSITGGQKA